MILVMLVSGQNNYEIDEGIEITEVKMLKQLIECGFDAFVVETECQNDLYRLFTGYKIRQLMGNPQTSLVVLRLRIDPENHKLASDNVVTIIFHPASGSFFPTNERGVFELGFCFQEKCEHILRNWKAKDRTNWKHNINDDIAYQTLGKSTTFPLVKCSLTVLRMYFIRRHQRIRGNDSQSQPNPKKKVCLSANKECLV